MLIRKATGEEMLKLWGYQDDISASPTAKFYYHNIASGNAVFWTLDNDGELIGELYVFLDLEDKDFADGKSTAYLCAFRVKEEYRGQGLGSRLMNAALAELRDIGFRHATIGVGSDKPQNIKLYRRFGFNVKIKDCHYDPCGMDENNQPEYEEEAWWLLGMCCIHHNFLFDLDQTLLDFHASEYIALGIVLRANGLSFSDEIYRAFKAYNKSLWLELEKGTISRTELFTKRFQDVFRRCDGDASSLDPLKINDEFIRTMSVNGVLMEGALAFVKKVKENIPDARIYIASNGATINAKGRIASTGLDRYIDGLFISEDMGVTKPDKAFFDICLDRIGEPGSSCIMIGDSLSSDMLGAKNASLDSVWFMPSGNIEEATAAYDINYCASSFDELYEVLRKWSASAG